MGNATEPPSSPWYRRISRECKSLVDIHVERRWGATREKQPIVYKAVYGGYAISLILTGYHALLVPMVGTPSLLSVAAGAIPAISKEEQIAGTGGLDCRQFNPEEWDQEVGGLDFDGSIWTVATGSPNGLLRFKEKISLQSDITVVFVPTSDSQVNFVITMHDLYELTIGDGSYQGVTLRTQRGDGQSMKITPTVDGERRVTFEGGQMEPGADVKVILSQGISRLENGSYELNLRIARSSFLERTPSSPIVFATYNFPLSPQYSYKENAAWFSLGLYAASDHTKVAADILCVDGVE